VRAAVVTGVGAISPMGGTAADSWNALLAGRSGIALLDDDWAAALPTRIAARMAVDPAAKMDRVAARRLDRAEQAALVAAREAWEDAKLSASSVDPERVAVVMGTGIGGVNTLLDNHNALRDHGPRRLSPRMVPMMMPNGAAAAAQAGIGAEEEIPLAGVAAGRGSAPEDGFGLPEVGRVVVEGEAAVAPHGAEVVFVGEQADGAGDLAAQDASHAVVVGVRHVSPIARGRISAHSP